MVEILILVLHVLVAGAVIVLVLLQHGRGADMGAAFGSGSSGSLFGSAGSANFLSRSTAVLATVFFLSSVALTYFGGASRSVGGGGVIKPTSTPPASTAPAPTGSADVPPVPAGTPPVPAPAPAGAPASGEGGKAGDVPK